MLRKSLFVVLIAGLLGANAPVFSADAANTSPDFGELTVHLRTYYLDRRRSTGENEAWAGGGWLGYQSPWLANTVRLGLKEYTSQRIWAPDSTDGTLLLKPRQESYTVTGEAYVALKLWDQVFTGYRQGMDLPEVNPQDNRMTPNTFQGYTLAGKFGSVAYVAGYLDRMKTRNADSFRDFAAVAGARPGVEQGMWVGGLTYKPDDHLAVRFSPYYVADVLTSTYADVDWIRPLSETLQLRLGAQYMYQSSNGDNLLTGNSFHTSAGGLKAELKRGPASLSLIYTWTGKGQAYRAPYGSWAGYTTMIVEDFDRAGETALLIGGAYDFARHGAPGLSAFVNAVFGDKAIDAATRAALSDKTEYDVTVDYRFTGDWPKWSKPLWIRLRGARVEEKTPAVTAVTNDYRVIVNYEWVLK